MIVAVDFDGTIVQDKYPAVGKVNRNTVEYLKYIKNRGTKLILWTCRDGKQLEEALKVCEENEVEFDAVNDNLPEIIEKYGNNSRKIYADMYIDDRVFMPCEKFEELLAQE